MRTAIILMILSIFILSGCGEQRTTGKAFIGGTEGLKTTLMPGNPPDEIFDNRQTNFAIVVKLENTGEDTIEANEGFVKIFGLEPGIYNINNVKKMFNVAIPGARKNYDGTVLNGGIATMEFGDLSYGLTVQGNLDQKLWLDICYKYTTKVTTQICIKKDPQLLLNNNKICDVEGEKNPQNSGAPIQVTSLKESFAGNGKIGVTMTISHLGKGDNFFDPRENLESNDACRDVESNNNRGRIHVKVKPLTLGGRTITPVCTGLSDPAGTNEGYIRLYKDGSGKEQSTLYCTINAESTDTIFEVPIDVELTYHYLQHIEKPFIIRHVAG